MNLVVTKNVTVVVREDRFELTAGQVLDADAQSEIPPGKLRSMRQINILVPENIASRFLGAPTHVEETTASTEQTPPSKLTTPLGELGLRQPVLAALTTANLATVGDVLSYGREHNTLQKLEGIGETSEKEVQEAITKLLS